MEWTIVEKRKSKGKKLLDELKLYEDLIQKSYKKEIIMHNIDSKPHEVDKGKIKCLRSTSCVINKVEIKQSEIHGKGVFAKKNIKIGELITFYPGDTVEYYWNGMNKELGRVLYWGESVIDTHTYACAVGENHAIIGNPRFEDASYAGHLINDAGKHNSSVESMEEYYKDDKLKTNCDFYFFNDLHVGIRATKNVKAGEELLIPYGNGYWYTYNEKRTVLMKTDMTLNPN